MAKDKRPKSKEKTKDNSLVFFFVLWKKYTHCRNCIINQQRKLSYISRYFRWYNACKIFLLKLFKIYGKTKIHY